MRRVAVVVLLLAATGCRRKQAVSRADGSGSRQPERVHRDVADRGAVNHAVFPASSPSTTALPFCTTGTAPAIGS